MITCPLDQFKTPPAAGEFFCFQDYHCSKNKTYGTKFDSKMNRVAMVKRSARRKQILFKRYPPSEPCNCEVCVGYCMRPGWWTVREATRTMQAGYGDRMMLEISPELTFGVLSPAFKGCEGACATNQFAKNGCTFLKNSRCELYGTGHQPLECRFCHHDRPGLGSQCHADLERDWNTPAGQALVLMWIKSTSFGKWSNFDGLSQIELLPVSLQKNNHRSA